MPPKTRRGAARSRTAFAGPRGVVKTEQKTRAQRRKKTRKEEPDRGSEPLSPVLQTKECEQGDQRPTLPIFPHFMYLTTNRKDAFRPSLFVTEPEPLSEEQKARVDEVKALVLQAFRAEVKGPVLELLVNAKAWQSTQLTKNEYHLLLYDLAKAPPLSHAMEEIKYDWMPNPNGYGVLTVRNPNSFEARLHKAVEEILVTRLNENELFRCLDNSEMLEPSQSAYVVANGNAGMRSPAHTYRHGKRPKNSAEHGNESNGLEDHEKLLWFQQDFVVELVPDRPDVAPGDKRALLLPDMIKGYLNAGTLCVMTVELRPRGGYDFSLPCWLHRLGTAGEVVRVPVDGKDNEPGLNLFDIVPAEFLQEAGVMGPYHEGADLVFDENGDSIQYVIEMEVLGRPLDQQLEELKEFTG